MDTFTTVLSVFSTVCAIVFGYIAFVRNRDKDKESNVKHDATVLTEIGYIKAYPGCKRPEYHSACGYPAYQISGKPLFYEAVLLR